MYISSSWCLMALHSPPDFLVKLLQLRPIAKNHYCCFLKKLHAYDELMSMYQ